MLARRLFPTLCLLLAVAVPAGAALLPGVEFTGRVLDAGGGPLAGASVTAAPMVGATTDGDGRYRFTAPATVTRGRDVTLTAKRIGYLAERRTVRVEGDTVAVDFVLRTAPLQLDAVVVTGMATSSERAEAKSTVTPLVAADAHQEIPASLQPLSSMLQGSAPGVAIRGATGGAVVQHNASPPPPQYGFGVAAGTAAATGHPRRAYNTEGYARIDENPFVRARVAPLSTFSIDVDHASYANVRRFLAQGQRPPADAVRIEELVNYFPYDNAAPRGAAPFAVTTEVGRAPWAPAHPLVRVALQARRVPRRELPPGNLVFLIDVSGSMQPANKLPLVRQALRLLVNELRPVDRVAIVVYAGAAGVVLPSTPGSDKARILDALDRLEAGGSTAGGAGLRLAYDVAREHHRRGANSRVILATDGDFNVGESSDAAMVRLVERRREEGTALTVLGVGEGNLQDAKMEQLADRGNGNYAYLDTLLEAQKALVHEMGGTLVTVAKDVKVQVEFNPRHVAAYRLLGYENRALRAEDFNDDARDAGELGAGHAVTALYELIPVGAPDAAGVRGVDPLRYRAPRVPARPIVDGTSAVEGGGGDELLFVKLRYKRPAGGPSVRLTHALPASALRVRRAPSADLTFASAVAMFGLVLRDSEHRGGGTLTAAAALARRSLGSDPGGYRAEFVRLAEQAARLVGGDDVVASEDRDR